MKLSRISSIRTVMGLNFVLAGASAYAACPQGTTAKGVIEGKTLCSLNQKDYLGQTLVLTSENHYLLESGTFVGGDNSNSSTLRIEAGTKVLGNPGAFLSISRGSKIFAEGTRAKPIVFTSSKLTARKRGEWGGLVINGNAPINACAGSAAVCEAISEGIKERQVKFGGNNSTDDSGSLKYLRVEFAGYPISQDNELNGITFNAVGSQTSVSNIQVHMNADDGVEFFGGTVNVKNLVLTGNEDDSIDWDMGYTGKIQFAVIEQANDSADSGIEADNLKSPMNASPRANPTLSNMTFIGGSKSGYGLLLRRGTGINITNTIVSGFTKGCIDIDDTETFSNGGVVVGDKIQATGLQMSHTLLDCVKPFEIEANESWMIKNWFESQEGNRVAKANLQDWIPAAGSPALGNGVTPDDLFFDPVDYIGALSPFGDNWTAGWTTIAGE